MIIRQKKEELILIRQHDHGFLSGEIAKHFTTRFFASKVYLKESIAAIYEHDRCWIKLDKTPIWNDAKELPYSFMDCPSSLRFVFYTLGLDEIEATNPYGALLCSKHFTSFPLNNEDTEMVHFYQQEQNRQKRLLKTLTNIAQSTLEEHYKLLKFCDELSLYACMNEPGVKKNEEIDLFKEGFEGMEIYNRYSDSPIIAEWIDEKKIRVTPFPFATEFKTHVRFKSLHKNEIEKSGIVQADKNVEFKKQEICFIR